MVLKASTSPTLKASPPPESCDARQPYKNIPLDTASSPPRFPASLPPIHLPNLSTLLADVQRDQKAGSDSCCGHTATILLLHRYIHQLGEYFEPILDVMWRQARLRKENEESIAHLYRELTRNGCLGPQGPQSNQAPRYQAGPRYRHEEKITPRYPEYSTRASSSKTIPQELSHDSSKCRQGEAYNVNPIPVDLPNHLRVIQSEPAPESIYSGHSSQDALLYGFTEEEEEMEEVATEQEEDDEIEQFCASAIFCESPGTITPPAAKIDNPGSPVDSVSTAVSPCPTSMAISSLSSPPTFRGEPPQAPIPHSHWRLLGIPGRHNVAFPARDSSRTSPTRTMSRRAALRPASSVTKARDSSPIREMTLSLHSSSSQESLVPLGKRKRDREDEEHMEGDEHQEKRFKPLRLKGLHRASWSDGIHLVSPSRVAER
ncbi:hypothetical protein C8J56DRAFT_138775 [Mycena floridula]|nr:hypothetical protein C8J56DRAFT_138775 [Mycena floridula]